SQARVHILQQLQLGARGMNQAPFADSVPVAQPEARSLLDSPCLNQLFCSSALLGSIEDAAFLLAGQLPAVASPVRLLASVWSPTAAPNCAGFSLNSWTVARTEAKLSGSWPKCCRRWAPSFQPPCCARPIAPLNEVAPPRPLRRHLDLYKALAPYDETVCCRRLRRSLAMQPWWTRRNTDLVQAYPCSSAMLLLLSIHYRGVAAPDGCRIHYAEPPSAELRPVHPAPSPAARPVGLCCILNIDRYEQADAPTQFHRRQGSACDVENISRVFKKLGYQILRSPNTTDEPDLLMTREKCIDFRDECFDEFGAGAYTSFVMFVMGHGKDAHDVLTADNQTLHCITDLVNLTCSQPMFSRQPKLFVFQFCRGEFVNFYTDGPSQEQSQPGTPAGHLQMNRSYTEVYQCYATLPSYKAMRSGDLGSFFIHYLCQYAEAQMKLTDP
uniref:CASPASE_P20 domain-containing protein n=1 Tax=Macrostomum lignano TaxID=282301 RepID=A0A1I8F8Z5_9PLAT